MHQRQRHHCVACTADGESIQIDAWRTGNVIYELRLQSAVPVGINTRRIEAKTLYGTTHNYKRD